MAGRSEISLGLLRLLVRIHELGTVSRAAEAVALSQPAASLRLRRLRQHLGDPLFVRSGNTMLPTRRCDEVVLSARSVLALVDQDILKAAPFDPCSAERRFPVALYDIGELVFLPRLLTYLLDHAPTCSLHSQSIHARDLPEALESGRVELAVGFYPNLERPSFYAQQLFDQRFLGLARRGHPAIGPHPPSLEQFLALSHVVVEPLGRGGDRLLGRVFDDRGLKRRIMLSTPHFLSVPQIVATTDLVATVPTDMAVHFAQLEPWQAFEPPINTPPYPVKQYWHTRFHNDPGHGWLRRSIYALFAA